MISSPPVLTLDGPSGAGKGTIGQLCSLKFGWHYLDSGAIYRGLAWLAHDQKIETDDVRSLVHLADNMELVCHVRARDVAQIEINGYNVTDLIRTDDAGQRASEIAPIKEVRAALLNMQRRCLKEPGLVADGRDMGTTVFPNAKFKVFLTASAEVRAQRRFDQLQKKGMDVSLARLIESIQARDVRDSSRDASPLKPAEGALVLDTTELTIDEVVARILALIN